MNCRRRASLRRVRHAGGFTLLETIVTLVVVSLIVVVLMQALRQALGLRERVLRFERGTRMATLQESWFRDSVGAALTDLHESQGAMRGSATSLRLTTAAPLDGDGPAQIRWALRRERDGTSSTLLYLVGGASGTRALAPGSASRQPDGAVPVLAGMRGASFAYLAADGGWKTEWTPDEHQPLPRMVRLTATTATGRLLWLVPIASDGRERRVLRPEELGLDF